MNYDETAEHIVEFGADVLTVVKPDWLDHMPLDVTVIDFMNPDKCPLYYAFGDFRSGDHALASHGFHNLGNCGMAHPAEFNNLSIYEIDRAYDAVNQVWHRVIKERRGDK